MEYGAGHLSAAVQTGLGIYYLLAVLLELGFAAYWYFRRKTGLALLWAAVGGIFLLHALIYLVHAGPSLPQSFRDFTTWLMGLYGGQMGPILYVTLAIIGFI